MGIQGAAAVTDAELTRLVRLLSRRKWREAVRNCLRGNDTCCFTSEAFISELERVCKSPYLPKGGDVLLGAKTILNQLGMVEVKPNVWKTT